MYTSMYIEITHTLADCIKLGPEWSDSFTCSSVDQFK